jgi:selenocysteine-specific translation elongation factor
MAMAGFMQNVIVAVPNDEELASFMGKRGAVNSITFYNRKTDVIIVTLAPTNMDDKFYAMAQAMLMADVISISTRNIDSGFGEALIAASLLQKKCLFTDESDVSQYLEKAALKDSKVVGRGAILDEISSYAKQDDGSRRAGAASVRVDIDKAFPVKGIGTVLLGIVREGTLRKHAKLYHSSGKLVEVRSIQSQDEDVEESEPGTRVGVAVKGLESDEVEKGDMLSEKPAPKAKRIAAKIDFSALAKRPEGDPFSPLFVSGFSSTMAKVSRKGDGYDVEFEKPIAIAQGDAFLLLGRDKPRIFAKGTCIAVGT